MRIWWELGVSTQGDSVSEDRGQPFSGPLAGPGGGLGWSCCPVAGVSGIELPTGPGAGLGGLWWCLGGPSGLKGLEAHHHIKGQFSVDYENPASFALRPGGPSILLV